MRKVKNRFRVVLKNDRVLWVESATWDFAGVTVSGPIVDGTSWAITSVRNPQDTEEPTSTLFTWPAVRQVDDFREAFDRQERDADLAEAKALEDDEVTVSDVDDAIDEATGQGRR